MARLMLVAGVLAVVVAAGGMSLTEPTGRSAVASGVQGRGGAGGAVFWTRGVIDHLAVDGKSVAVSTRGITGSCDRIVVWTTPGQRFVTFETRVHCAGNYAYTQDVAEVALGAGRVAWIEEEGGNQLDQYLYGASSSGGPSKGLATAYNGYYGAGDADWVGQLHGSGPLLAYNLWTTCNWILNDDKPTDDCPTNYQVSGATLWRLSATGTRVRLRSGVSSFRLLAVGGGRLAIEATTTFWIAKGRSGTVTVLSATGRLVTTVPAVEKDPPRAVALSSTQLVIERHRTLDLHNPASGTLTRTIPLGSATRLQLVGANAKLAILSGLHRLIAIRLTDGKQAIVPLPAEAKATTSPISPRLSEAGLFYAYNVASTPARGRIVFTPTSDLLARFRNSG